MAYTITVRVYQSDPSLYFSLAEKTVWSDTAHYPASKRSDHTFAWSESKDGHVLLMANSGSSGTLRFRSNTNEEVIFAFGVHNYKRWCDVVPDAPGDTAMIVNAEYYNDGKRAYQRENQLAEYSRDGPRGRHFEVKYTVVDGTNLQANITIGRD